MTILMPDYCAKLIARFDVFCDLEKVLDKPGLAQAWCDSLSDEDKSVIAAFQDYRAAEWKELKP